VAVLGVGIAQGAVPLPLNIGLSGVPFQLKADKLSADHFAQYAYPDQLGPAGASMAPVIGALAAQKVGLTGTVNNTVTVGGNVYAADTVTQLGDNIKIDNLNQTICAPVPGFVGQITNAAILVHIVGSGTTTATAMTIQAPALSADGASFTDFFIGQTVARSLAEEGLTPAYAEDTSSLASIAQHARTVELTKVDQVGLGTEAATFNLSGLKVWTEWVPPGSCAVSR
jgi:hypothetical protein